MSITTATFNSEATLARTIESVLAQDYPLIEYVIMDGCSTDATLEIAYGYKAAFADRGWRFEIVSEPDSGMYDAINKAMDRCTGEFLGNVNSDDYYEQDAAHNIVYAFNEAPYDVLYADLRVHTGTGSFIKQAREMGPYPTSRKWNHPTMFLARRARSLRYRTDGNPYADFDLYLQAVQAGMEIRPLSKVVSNFSFGGMSTRKKLSDVRKRIGWRNEIYRDNHCPPLTYVEGVGMEIAKYLKA